MIAFLFAAAFLPAVPASPEPDLLEQGYRQMYNLDFDGAHRTFREYETRYPADAMGPVSDAAAWIFSEFDRLRILQSEFFVNNETFLNWKSRETLPGVRSQFEADLERGLGKANAMLSKSPDDRNALLALVMRNGLRADFLSLIERRNMAALSVIKESHPLIDRLTAKHPDCYDVYLAVGLENYLLSLKPAPVRWLLRVGGAQTSREVGVTNVSLTAEKGRYLKPYARLLLAVAALRDKNVAEAKKILSSLATEFPKNHLYREELARLR